MLNRSIPRQLVLPQIISISFEILPVLVWSPSISVVISIPVLIPILVPTSIPVIPVGAIVAAVIPTVVPTMPPRTAAGCQHETYHCRPVHDSSESVHKAPLKNLAAYPPNVSRLSSW